ncbi:MAG: hypothetical protein A2V70_07495 [Planctomycetes bacterium RBG_13_63_9]|nr:MAG: hypothetical protein A2V70_07495 [Planctomycetes bacterium RBG_13_63_9]
MNYGLVFTAWGMGGFMLSLGAGAIYKAQGTLAYAYYGAASLLILASIVTVVLRAPHVMHEPAAEAVPEVV